MDKIDDDKIYEIDQDGDENYYKEKNEGHRASNELKKELSGKDRRKTIIKGIILSELLKSPRDKY